MKNTNEKIIIIGAGFAGLTAGKLLHESGFDVTILEGDNRIGGRTNTIRLGKAIVDTGATWIHYKKGNLITALAKAYGFEVVNDDYEPYMIWDSENGEIPRKKRNKYLKAAEKARDAAIDFFQENQGNANTETFFDAYVNQKDWSPKKAKIVRFLYSCLLETDYGTSMDNISLSDERHITTFDKNYENDALIVGGYARLITKLRQKLDIRLSEVIEKIDYSKENPANKIRISTQNNVFECDKVIVTVSLGVLKKEVIEFVPPLPPEKINAIQSMGYGNLEKIILTFDNVFWGEERLIYYYEQQEKHLPFPMILDFTETAGAPTLGLYCAANFANELLQKSDEDILEIVVETLQNIFGEAMERPTHHHISRWSTDPFQYGSYSYTCNDDVEEIITQLAKPIDDKVFFAGEATSLKGQAYVHGAMFSAIREAVRLGGDLNGIKGLEDWL